MLSTIKGAKSDGDVSIGCSDVSAGICNIVDDISLSHQTTVSKVFSDIQQDKHQSSFDLHLIRPAVVSLKLKGLKFVSKFASKALVMSCKGSM